MTTIGITQKAFEIVLEKRVELERKERKVVSLAAALDCLLGVK